MTIHKNFIHYHTPTRTNFPLKTFCWMSVESVDFRVFISLYVFYSLPFSSSLYFPVSFFLCVSFSLNLSLFSVRQFSFICTIFPSVLFRVRMRWYVFVCTCGTHHIPPPSFCPLLTGTHSHFSRFWYFVISSIYTITESMRLIKLKV